MPIPDTLTERIELFRDNALAYQGADDMFRVDSWVQVMIGQRIRPRSYHHMGRLMEADQLRLAFDTLTNNRANAATRIPTHRDFLSAYTAGSGK